VPREELADVGLAQLAVAAYLIGEDDEAVAARQQAYKRHADAEERAEAARCAFWAAFCLMMRGQMAHAGGWLSRGESVLGEDLDCPARRYLLIPALLSALDCDDAAAARQLAVQAGEIAARFRDTDLEASSTLGHGQALLDEWVVGAPRRAGTGRRSQPLPPVGAGRRGEAIVVEGGRDPTLIAPRGGHAPAEAAAGEVVEPHDPVV
jgi:hypothetical protein